LPLLESRAKALEQLILLLHLELALENEIFQDGSRALLTSEDFEFELNVKKKRILRLVNDEN
jgi:hypothetical protein